VPTRERYQRIFFSLNLDYMLERLVNQKVQIFKREQEFGQKTCKFTLVKRIENFPKDISEVSYNNYLFSPDLMYYVDFDLSKSNFHIKETLT